MKYKHRNNIPVLLSRQMPRNPNTSCFPVYVCYTVLLSGSIHIHTATVRQWTALSRCCLSDLENDCSSNRSEVFTAVYNLYIGDYGKDSNFSTCRWTYWVTIGHITAEYVWSVRHCEAIRPVLQMLKVFLSVLTFLKPAQTLCMLKGKYCCIFICYYTQMPMPALLML